MKKIIFFLFAALAFLIPLILWPYTSEIFEFNKMVVVYIFTILIMGAWTVREIIEGKFIFRRTLLDLPLLVFLGIQVLSTVFSIDPHTSTFGYYSRFNGGLLSFLSYSLLYWAFVSNLNKKYTIKIIFSLIASALVVSIYGILQHFGIDKDIWVQDVQNRVFSSLGQPNWLAAFLVALIPLTWTSLIKKPYTYILSTLFFATLLFTKSRSGLLGFVTADLIFWGFVLIRDKQKYLKEFLIFNSIFLLLFFSFKTPFTSPQTVVPNAPALETGGTESGSIRKIVWKGAVGIWKAYPILGTGPETFAYSYYGFRPIEHNLVSEWDFIYNKAHNEYLNFAANTGLLGLISYLILMGTSIVFFLRLKDDKKSGIITISLFAGYASILVSNFFGFSVVPTQLQLFLFPAIAFGLSTDIEAKSVDKNKKLNVSQKILAIFLIAVVAYLLFVATRYWYADTLYAKAKSLNKSDDPIKAQELLSKAITISPKEPFYYLEIAESYTKIALALSQSDEKDKTQEFVDQAIAQSKKAEDLSPSNVNIKRIRFSMFIRLSLIDPKYLIDASKILTEAIKEAPTDAKLFYNLGLTYARLGQLDLALTTIEKAIELKGNYKEARLARAFLLIDKGERAQAKAEIEYILSNIDPNDSIARSQLEELK